MNNILIAAILLILCGTMLFGCTKNPPIDNNKVIIDNNQSLAVCADKIKHMVITQTVEGETWECV
jgi:hypothetical protein